MADTTPRRSDDRKPWSTPQLRSVIPAHQTRGGGGDIADQDDTLYDVS
jgi:hypothetical protein